MKNASASNLHLILDEALAQYRELTGHELTAHPLAANFENWNSVDTVLDVFQDQSQKFSEFRKGNERLMEWLKPTVQVLVSVSGSLGNALSTVGFED
jgi:STAND-like protein